MKKRLQFIISSVLLSVALSCTGLPGEYTQDRNLVRILPDYTDVTVPENIAPMNFYIMADASAYATLFTTEADTRYVVKGRTVRIPVRRWRSMLAEGPVSVQIFMKMKDSGKWTAFRPFKITPSAPIDRYVSYRQIPPSFKQYDNIRLRQRDLSTFRDKVFYSNSMVQRTSTGQGQCVNCHSFRNYGTDDMQFHTRQYRGGTVIYHDGELRMVNMSTENTVSAGVYPAWHPVKNLIAYSTNSTMQSFHTLSDNHIEVFDSESDLILYDIDANKISTIEAEPDQLECFPAWSPDGRMLYYVSASIPQVPAGVERSEYVAGIYDQLKYDIYRKSFDPESGRWGKAELVYQASARGKSATLPRISPDGKRLMFTMGEYGVFHIWHNDADLYVLDLETMQARAIREINSSDTESYHSWSSNGEWVIFGTRREDGGYTRLYISHVNPDGSFSKPFTVPQKNPWSNTDMLTSYNIPEFTKTPVKVSARKLARFVRNTKVVRVQ